MKRFLLFSLILQIVHSSCPDGFEVVENECRGKYATVSAPWNQGAQIAIEKCNGILGQPVIIHDEEHEKYWQARTKNTNPYFPIALVCNSLSKKWEWSDGSHVDYRSSGVSTDLDAVCKQNCAWYLWDDSNRYSWDMDGCIDQARQMDIFCTVPLRQPTNDDGYESFADDDDDGRHGSRELAEAQMNCKKLGANLASIHNLQENSFLRRLAVSKGAVNGLFLGATLAGKGMKFGWVEGSEWDYTNFYPGFPMPGLGDCIAMDTATSKGQWMNIDCSEQLPVACIREQRSITEPTCSPDPAVEGAITTSPGFPYSASTPCDFFLTAEAGKTVELEIILLEANPCCDSLVIHDKFLGGNMIANLTGEVHNATYTSSSNLMRVSWQPHGGVNVRGLAMAFRGV